MHQESSGGQLVPLVRYHAEMRRRAEEKNEGGDDYEDADVYPSWAIDSTDGRVVRTEPMCAYNRYG